MKKASRVLITVGLMSSLIVTPVSAEPNNIDELEKSKNEAQAKVEDVNAQLVELLIEFDVLQSDIENQKVKIKTATGDLKKAEATEKQQYEDMKLRIKYMYEEGDGTYLQTLLSATSFSDLLNKSEYIQSVHGYDRTMLKKYQKTKEKVASKKEELETQQADMEFMASEYTRQKANMETTLTKMRAEVDDFDSQLASAKEAAKAEQERMEADTAAMQASASSSESKSTASGSSGSKGTASGGVSSKPTTSVSSSGNSSKPSSSSGNNSSKPEKEETDEPSSGSSGNSGTSNAALGQKIVNEALKYVGNPYVFGGNSLTNGIDCSGFTSQIHAKFGISVPRSSSAQRTKGKAVSFSAAMPGDIICYSGHVAIYMGNNKIVHASNSAPYPKGGIKVSNDAGYRTILAVRRYW